MKLVISREILMKREKERKIIEWEMMLKMKMKMKMKMKREMILLKMKREMILLEIKGKAFVEEDARFLDICRRRKGQGRRNVEIRRLK